MTCTIGVTWYPRPDEVLQFTSFTYTGATFIIYPDGHRLKHETGDEVRLLGNHAGCFRHWYRVLNDLVRNTESDCMGIIPDDVYLRPDAIAKAVEALADPRVGYAAMYAPVGVAKMQSRFRATRGWGILSGGWGKNYGGCYVFRRDVAERILNHPYIINHRDNYAKNQQIDAAIPELMHRLGLRQLMHNPSLAQHCGHTSTIGHRHSRNEDALNWGEWENSTPVLEL